MKIERLQNESYIAYVTRVTNAFFDNLITAQDWSNAILGKEIYSEENLRRCAVFFEEFIKRLDGEHIKNIEDSDLLQQINNAKDELIKERKKIQTANIEYNTNIRNEARLEMFNERLAQIISQLKPIKFTKYLSQDNEENIGVLCIADAHNGVEINLQTLFGEVVNVYSPEILKGRLDKLLNQVVKDCMTVIDYDKLIIFDLGDAIQNILRMSDIVKLKIGVLESVLNYAELISTWLVELSNRLKVPVEYICLGGNHAELRLLESKQNFEEENLGRLIREFIYLRLKDNPNITVAPYSEFGFKSIQGTNILAIHGNNAKSSLEEISYWENYHGISIDILLMGHEHHGEQTTVGYGLLGDKEIIKVPSLVGIDTYSKKLRRIARAGAKFMLFEDGLKTWEKTICLN